MSRPLVHGCITECKEGTALGETADPTLKYRFYEPSSKMVCVIAHDDQNTLFLTEGYLPTLEDMRKIFPRCSTYARRYAHLEPSGLSDPDESKAWIFTAYAHALMTHRGQGRKPIQTWLIGPPKGMNGELAQWFEGEPSDTNYRLLINRKPPTLSGNNHGRFYDVPQKNLIIKHRQGKHAHLKRISEPFLDDLLKAYTVGHEAVEERVKRTNHFYAFSDGLIDY